MINRESKFDSHCSYSLEYVVSYSLGKIQVLTDDIRKYEIKLKESIAMHEGKHGILDGLEDMDDLFGLEEEDEQEHKKDSKEKNDKEDKKKKQLTYRLL